MTELRTHAELVGALLERDAEIVRLRKALKGLLANSRCPVCESSHHKSNQYHGSDESCPVEVLYIHASNEARAALEEDLGNACASPDPSGHRTSTDKS